MLRRSFYRSVLCASYLHHEDTNLSRKAGGTKGHKEFSLTIRITGAEECDARDGESSNSDDIIKIKKRTRSNE
jgi:hypothetical protein